MTGLDPEPADRAADAAGADGADAQLAVRRLRGRSPWPQDRGQAERAGGDQQRAAFDIDEVAHRDLQDPEMKATPSSCRRPDRATDGRAGPTIVNVSARSRRSS